MTPLLCQNERGVKTANRLLTVTMISFVIGRVQKHCSILISLAAKKRWASWKDPFSFWYQPRVFGVDLSAAVLRRRVRKELRSSRRNRFHDTYNKEHMLFTRATYLDKVHHSAVRCIFWSSPLKGSSSEHTYLFLAKVSEKVLWSCRAVNRGSDPKDGSC